MLLYLHWIIVWIASYDGTTMQIGWEDKWIRGDEFHQRNRFRLIRLQSSNQWTFEAIREISIQVNVGSIPAPNISCLRFTPSFLRSCKLEADKINSFLFKNFSFMHSCAWACLICCCQNAQELHCIIQWSHRLNDESDSINLSRPNESNSPLYVFLSLSDNVNWKMLPDFESLSKMKRHLSGTAYILYSKAR